MKILVPGLTITGEYEGDPQTFTGIDLEKVLESNYSISDSEGDFIRKCAFGFTDILSGLDRDQEIKLGYWYIQRLKIKSKIIRTLGM